MLRCSSHSSGGVAFGRVGVRGAQARRGGEDAAGVEAGELAGFGDGVEDLGVCEAVGGEVVDGFVAFLELGVVGGCGEHFVDGAGVGEGQWFVLLELVCLFFQAFVRESKSGEVMACNQIKCVYAFRVFPGHKD